MKVFFLAWKNINLFFILIFPSFLQAALSLHGILPEDPFTRPIDLWKRLYDEFDKQALANKSYFNDDGTITFYNPAVSSILRQREIIVLFAKRGSHDHLCKWLVSASPLASQLSLNEVKSHGSVEGRLYTSELYSQEYLAAIDEELAPYTFQSQLQRIFHITCKVSEKKLPISQRYRDLVESEDQKTVRIIKPRFRFHGVKRRIDSLSPAEAVCAHYGFNKYVENSLVKKTLGLKWTRNIVRLNNSQMCVGTKSNYSDTYIKEISCQR